MDIITLISNSIDSLAWPIAAVLIIFMLRKDVGNLLLNITHIKHNNTEIKLGKDIEKTKKLAKDQPELNSIVLPDQKTKDYELAILSPRGAIIESWLTIEEALNGYAKRYNIQRSGRKPFTIKDAAWHSLDYKTFGKGTLEILTNLRTIRNNAVHLQDSDIKTLNANEYVMLAKQMVQRINEA